MSNHGPNPFENFDEEDPKKMELFNSRRETLKNLMESTAQFRGALGDFPEGQIAKDDEGAIQFAIGSKGDKVVIDFGKQVHWLAMTPEQAADLASTILNHARNLGRRQGKTITFQL